MILLICLGRKRYTYLLSRISTFSSLAAPMPGLLRGMLPTQRVFEGCMRPDPAPRILNIASFVEPDYHTTLRVLLV
ncbi:hypothetical protein I7I50_08583 [Histoplasma capsulatum G186AR]|uniref:Uncharacterized protein n=1 Tax=Ajellomyces capsulatus TaxID=5037 RepID=A0A8H7YNP5_AJECA|nr:hypothetical protein I7I52_06098 [Histoplasma capsulatum]QSS73701.1 hypothetical protein I7I50_08583 [Histoplasma capsulatum G186AR]